MSADSAKTVKQICSVTVGSADINQRELPLRTVFGENAKGLDRLSEVTPCWTIELSNRQWHDQIW